MKHKAGEGEVVEPCEGLFQALVVARQATEPSGPEAALHDPSARQKGEASYACRIAFISRSSSACDMGQPAM